ncbi:MAG: hypothetical protein ACREFG_07835 [Chthoniobacterales bacterium]
MKLLREDFVDERAMLAEDAANHPLSERPMVGKNNAIAIHSDSVKAFQWSDMAFFSCQFSWRFA